MRAAKHPGECKICGQLKELTEEHIPPRNAFNSANVVVLSFDEVVKTITNVDGRMPWDTRGLKDKVQQGGHKRCCLCREWNNTGSWYMRTYTDFTKPLNAMILQEGLTTGSSYSFVIKDIFPSRLYKARITLICDINNKCFGDDDLRHFIMEKTNNSIGVKRYSLYMYFVSAQMPRISGLAAHVTFDDGKTPILVSEIASYPIGFALYLETIHQLELILICWLPLDMMINAI